MISSSDQWLPCQLVGSSVRILGKRMTNILKTGYRAGRIAKYRHLWDLTPEKIEELADGWAHHPADFLIRHLLGLKILEPGCRKLRVAPRRTAFDYHVVFPTPLGHVTAEWTDGLLKLSSPDSVEIQNEEEDPPNQPDAGDV